jgi:hypothetical protein
LTKVEKDALVYHMIFPRDICYQHTTIILPTNQGCHLAFFETEMVCQNKNELSSLDLKKYYLLRPVLAKFKQNFQYFITMQNQFDNCCQIFIRNLAYVSQVNLFRKFRFF